MKLHNFNIKKMKVLAIAGLTLVNSNFKAFSSDFIPINIKVEIEGEPEYANKLYNVLSGLDDNIKKIIEGYNLNIVILDGEDSVEKVILKSLLIYFIVKLIILLILKNIV